MHISEGLWCDKAISLDLPKALSLFRVFRFRGLGFRGLGYTQESHGLFWFKPLHDKFR